MCANTMGEWRLNPNHVAEMLELFFTTFRNSLPVHIYSGTDAFNVLERV